MATPRRNRPVQDRIAALTPDALNRFTQVNPNYLAEETQKLDAKYSRLYLQFCERVGIRPFPLNSINLIGFMTFMSETYKVSSLYHSVWPSLRRLNKSRTGRSISKSVLEDFSRYRKGLAARERQTMPGIDVVDDTSCVPFSTVMFMIQVSIDQIRENAQHAVIILFGALTGARACSVSSIRVGDIISVRRMAEVAYEVVIRIRRTKGTSTAKQDFTFTGNLLRDSTVNRNIIYWLDRYLSEFFNLNLARYPLWPNIQRQRNLFTIKTEGMNRIIKGMGSAAGIHRGITFHGLRRGLIFNHVVGCEGDIANGLLTGTVLGNWSLKSKVRDKYYHESLRRLSSTAAFTGGDPLIRDGTTINAIHGVAIDHPMANLPFRSVGLGFRVL